MSAKARAGIAFEQSSIQPENNGVLADVAF
jgi:hypothetical protein